MICLGYSRLPTAASDVFRRGIRFEAVRYDLAVFRFHDRTFFFTDFGGNLFNFFPVLVAASMLFTIRLIAGEGLDFRVLGVRELRRGISSVRRTGRFFLRLIKAARRIDVVLYGATRANRSIRFAALFMTTCNSRFHSARQRILVEA